MCDSVVPQTETPANPSGIDAGMSINTQEQSMAQPTPGTDTAGQPFMTVKYNKEELPLSQEAAVTYAQKGMNYDKLSARLKEADEKLGAYENDDFFKIAKAFAEKTGQPVDDVKTLMRTQMDKAIANCERQATVDAQLGAFMKAHPDINPRELPVGVLDAWRSGVPLGDAYQAHMAAQMKAQAAREQTNQRNAGASMGRPQSRGRAHSRVLSDEVIRTMSPRELERDHNRIWAYLTGADKERR